MSIVCVQDVTLRPKCLLSRLPYVLKDICASIVGLLVMVFFLFFELATARTTMDTRVLLHLDGLYKYMYMLAYSLLSTNPDF
jgi:hypothetical protein